MNGKTSKPRPYSIPLAEYGERWDEIFRRSPVALKPDAHVSEIDVGGGGAKPTLLPVPVLANGGRHRKVCSSTGARESTFAPEVNDRTLAAGNSNLRLT